MEFTIHTTFPEDLETEWNALLEQSANHVPFLRFEYLNAWWQTRGGGEWPDAHLFLVTARENGSLVGIAPLFTADWQEKRSLLLLGSIEVSDYLDLIVRSADLPEFISGVLTFLKQNQFDWQRLDLYNLLDNSPTLPALKMAAESQGMNYSDEKLQHSPYIQLPGDWETYLAGIDKKQRHEIRRKMRRAYESADSVRWYIVQDRETLDSEIEDFLSLMAHEEVKAAFLTKPMRDHMRNTMRCAFDKGCLNLAFLEINGQKAAGYISFDYLNRLWVYNSGLNPGFREYSPGWVLLGELLKWANEQQFEAFDFMRGDEEYKYRFGATDRFVLRASINRN